MATDKTQLAYIVNQLTGVGSVRTRSMMGEYLLYVDEVLVGQIADNELFIKVTPYGESILPAIEKASPYPGAKPAFVISPDQLEDAPWLVEFVRESKKQLPAK